MENIETGSTININRSDGRVHPAVVVAINQEGNFVRVEWFENGETKGKDLDFRVASLLNPNLKFKKQESPEFIKQSLPNANKIPRKNTAINDRRTNIAGRRVAPLIKELEPEIIPKLPMTRSQMKDPQYQNSFTQELSSKIDNTKTDKRNKKSLAPKDAGTRRTQNNQNKKLAAMVSKERTKLVFSPLATDEVAGDHLITVCVRKRPLNKFEINKNEVDIISIPKKNSLIVHEPKTKVDLTRYIDNHNFKFDYAFDDNCNNSVVYKYTAQPLVKTMFEGGFATCFAYGQTGSGKTYTMSGDVSGGSHDGIYALAIADVFKLINSPKYKHLSLIVSCSFFEIYGGKVLDLLNAKTTLKILEDGKQQVQVVGLTEKHVTSTNEVMNLISKGDILRTSGQTSANANSSRSHAVFQIYVRKSGTVYGKLSLIDLAGNERGADTFSSDRQTRLEGGEINKSLLALKECIRALGRRGAHLPFRVSKLTHVLRDSFVGNNSRTCMIAMVSPGVGSCENTLNTLRYADRVKELGSGDQSNETTATNSKVDIPAAVPCIEDEDCEDVEFRYTNDLQDSENKLVENHRQISVKLTETAKQAQNLLKMTNGYAFDKTSYVNKFQQLMDDTISQLLETKEYIDDFKSKLDHC